MRQIIVRLTIAFALVALGWVSGRAQNSAPDFTISVSAPMGHTDIRCLRGCRLAFIEGQINVRASAAKPTFSFSCSEAHGCPSGILGGWLAQ